MKTIVHLRNTFNRLMLAIVCLIAGVTASAQTYTTITNGAWSSAATWQGGVIPNANSIPSTAVILIKHRVFYAGLPINNNGTIMIANQSGITPRLVLDSGIKIYNYVNGKIFVTNAELRQHRFLGGGQSGVALAGNLYNYGYISCRNSYIEIAEDWLNDNSGKMTLWNSSLVLGKNYTCKASAIDSILYSSISVGIQGSGSYTATGFLSNFQTARIQVASSSGKFTLGSDWANGSIDYITLKNHVTNSIGTGRIETDTKLNPAGGLLLNAYCVSNGSQYISNGKFSGPQIQDCSLNYFPAPLFASITPGQLDFSENPILIAGTDKLVGATYKYESVAPGIDAIVRVDSLVNGATLIMLDDNADGSGFKEALQPQVRSGNAPGNYYVVLKISHKLTGTQVSHEMATFTVTGLDIDGTATVKEFQEFHLGPGAVSGFMVGTPQILVTQLAPGAFRGVNISGVTVNGVDTTTLSHMFTVSGAKISDYTIKVGISQTSSTAVTRLFSNYYKGFVYPVNTTLPVKMESFTATLNKNNKVDLKWTTASEINVSHFVIERSIDGTNYSDIGIAFAFGDLSTKTNYSMVDDITGLKSTIVYYRIRSVDNDSKAQYSDTRMIRMGSATDNSLTIMTYPNPVTNELRITVPDSWQNKQVLYELVSGNGTIVNKTTVANSSQTETMNVSKLAPGFYILRAVCNGVMAQQKIIKH